MKQSAKTIIAALLITLLGGVPPTTSAADNFVYMIALVKLRDTSYSQVIFFSSDEITSPEQCEKEREYGLTSGWRIYSHQTLPTRGMQYSVTYHCAQSQQLVSNWIGSRSGYDKVYLVRRDGLDMTLARQENYSVCLKTLREEQNEESQSLFCGRSNQEILR